MCLNSNTIFSIVIKVRRSTIYEEQYITKGWSWLVISFYDF